MIVPCLSLYIHVKHTEGFMDRAILLWFEYWLADPALYAVCNSDFSWLLGKEMIQSKSQEEECSGSGGGVMEKGHSQSRGDQVQGHDRIQTEGTEGGRQEGSDAKHVEVTGSTGWHR